MKDIILSLIYVVLTVLIIRIYFIQTMWNIKYGHGIDEKGGTHGDSTAVIIILCILSPVAPETVVVGCIAVLAVSQIIIFRYIKGKCHAIYADDPEKKMFYDKEIKKSFKRAIICIAIVAVFILLAIFI